jgi:hypothetical protein
VRDFSSPRWQRLRAEILERDHYECKVRGPKCRRRATEVDHIVPVADGGSMWDPQNLRAACGWCNSWRAARQKSSAGWKRSKTRIILVIGPMGAGKAAYVREQANPGDLVIDYDALAGAMYPGMEHSLGGNRHKLVNELRGRLLRQIRRGETASERVWIISANPKAESIFPFHEVVIIDPGREEVLRRCEAERPEILFALVDKWYADRITILEPSIREW